MLYEKRKYISAQILQRSALESESIILFGSGVWFNMLERTIARDIIEYSERIELLQLKPMVRASFLGNGVLQCIDLSTGCNMNLITRGSAVAPDTAYLVEDSHGDNAKVWDDTIRPFLSGSDASVIYLGSGQDEYIKKY